MIEIRTLRYFLAVAREENMTQVAEQLHVTQPTLSKALKSLEDELDKKLFTRYSFSIQLTNEGILLRDRAKDLVSMAEKLRMNLSLWMISLAENSAPGAYPEHWRFSDRSETVSHDVLCAALRITGSYHNGSNP